MLPVGPWPERKLRLLLADSWRWRGIRPVELILTLTGVAVMLGLLVHLAARIAGVS